MPLGSGRAGAAIQSCVLRDAGCARPQDDGVFWMALRKFVILRRRAAPSRRTYASWPGITIRHPQGGDEGGLGDGDLAELAQPLLTSFAFPGKCRYPLRIERATISGTQMDNQF